MDDENNYKRMKEKKMDDENGPNREEWTSLSFNF